MPDPRVLPFPASPGDPSSRPTPSDARPAARLPLTVRKLSFVADGTCILDGIDLDLADNRLTVIMGPNGAGKSVLLKLLHGLLAPSAGRILWGGRELDRQTRQRQAMVFQKPVLFRRSVRANLQFAVNLKKSPEATELLSVLMEDLHLHDLADRPARLLSGGEQQRLALARALLLAPDILFLDEPCANLDPASMLLIEETLHKARASGTKVLLVTHDLHQARRLAEDVVFLHRGRLTEHSDADSYFETPASPEARAYLAGQILL